MDPEPFLIELRNNRITQIKLTNGQLEHFWAILSKQTLEKLVHFVTLTCVNKDLFVCCTPTRKTGSWCGNVP